MTGRPTENEERPVGARRAVIGAGVALLLSAGSVWPARPPVTLVVCAPGYPGSTAEAQSAMDALASAVASAAGWQPGELTAVYYETEQGGLARLAQADAALALVPLPFWLQHREALSLLPELQAIQQGGEAAEVWSLVTPASAGARSSDLAGYEIRSLAGYAPRFVRGPALGEWGALPRGVTITFSPAVLSGLRQASAGTKIAMLLDAAQAAALPSLPYAAKLKVVARSRSLPVSVLCTVGKRLPAARLPALLKALTSLGSQPGGADAMAGVRMKGFVRADQPALANARAAFERAEE